VDQGWRIEHRRGTAQELHDLAASEPVEGRAVIVQEVVAPAIVLGSTQRVEDVDVVAATEAGVDVARRRSGGGAVLLRPGDHVWVDLVIGAQDPLADSDVGRAAWWVGEVFREALGLAGGAVGGDAVVHRGGVSDRDLARVACFAAVGPGEITVDGRKVLGVSQRRSRAGARFQCVVHRSWDPQLLLVLLSPASVSQNRLRSALIGRVAAAAGPEWDVVEDLVPALP